MANVNVNLKFIKDEDFVAEWGAEAAQVADDGRSRTRQCQDRLRGHDGGGVVTAQLLDGSALAKEIKARLKDESPPLRRSS